MLPVNADALDLAAQCLAARGQAEEMLQLLRRHAWRHRIGDATERPLRIDGANVPFCPRTPDAGAGVAPQATSSAAANEDAWALHVAEQSMLAVVDPGAELLAASLKRGWSSVAQTGIGRDADGGAEGLFRSNGYGQPLKN